MQRELTYHVPFERMMKLSRWASRKVYPSVRWLAWLWAALFIPVLVFLYAYGDEIRDVAEDEGIPFSVELMLAAVLLAFFVGLRLLRRYHQRLMRSRANLDQIVRLKQDDGGLRFATDDIEHYLKWQGLTQMLLAHDGIVLSQGNLFFLVPDKAFASADERAAFIRDVYGRLSEKARALSERHVRAVLRESQERASVAVQKSA